MPQVLKTSRRPRRHSAFTMLEVVIAIAVIMVLIGMLFIGGRSLFGAAKANETKARLGSARAMLSDFMDATKPKAGSSRPQPTGAAAGDVAWIHNGADVTQGDVTLLKLSFWLVPNGNDTNTNGVIDFGTAEAFPLDAPGVFAPGPLGNEPSAYYNTRVAITLMSRLPSVAKVLNELPSSSRETTPAPAPPGSQQVAPGKHLLDAWGFPILFVPGTGLMGVTSGGVVFDATNPIKSDGQPFWASAGPDGNFTTGDDNIYSFQN